MRGRRLAATIAVFTGAWLLGPVTASQASHLPTGTPIVCNITAFVVFTPNNVTQGEGEGEGVFGTAVAAGVPLPSAVACTGAINGRAVASGTFDFCANDHGGPPGNEHLGTDPAPCGGTPKGDIEHLYHRDNPTATHVHGAGLFDGDDWVWADTSIAPDCEVTFNGHGLLPVELDVFMDCDGHEFHFPSPGNVNLVPLFDAGGDLIHRNPDEGADFQHCEVNDTTHPHEDEDGNPFATTWNQDNPGERPFCFRAVVINGTIAGTLT